MVVIKKYKRHFYFHLVLNIIIGLVISFSSYIHLPLFGIKDYLFYGVHFLVLQFTIFGFLYLISLHKRLFFILFPILFLLFSLASYWVYSQDITVSQNIIQVALETKLSIVWDLISVPLILYILFILLLIFILLKMFNNLNDNKIRSPLTILAIIAVLTYWTIELYRDGTLERRLPYSLMVALYDYYQKPVLQLQAADFNTIKNDSLQVILILGESVRADHLRLNGYYRNTTPNLIKIEQLVSFPHAFTPHTFTASSVPQILTDLSVNDQDNKPKFSLIDMLNKAQIKTNWIGNQTPEKSYNTFIEQSQNHYLHDPLHSEINFKKALDINLLPYIKKALQHNMNQFMVVHVMGSHWYYENRYDKRFRKYFPVTKSKNLSSNSNESIINSYDNTIVYMDYFVSQLIDIMQINNENRIIIYLSDHGEILGEDGKWLHAQSHKAATNPAMFFWYSKSFKNKHPDFVTALETGKNKNLTLDFLYHSVLHIYGFPENSYNKKLSVFNRILPF